ncbi:universal stress protein, partial [Streptomyces californicus]
VARDAVRAAQGEPAGDAEVPVEPGVQRPGTPGSPRTAPPPSAPGAATSAGGLSRAQDQLGAEAYQVVGSAPAEDTLRAARDRAREQGAPEVRTLAVQDDPVPALVNAAAEHGADLLVVGNRGLRSLAGRILGSVPADIARKAGLDVLIVHTT